MSKIQHSTLFADVQKVCEACHITLNKVTIFDDNGNITPGGVRIGTPAMTSRGCLESDFEMIADILGRAAQISSCVQRDHGYLEFGGLCCGCILGFMRPHYNVNLKSIAVNGQTLSIDSSVFSITSNRGTTIDSGTTLAYLADEAYDPIINAFHNPFALLYPRKTSVI
ncbi:hypothetical protein ACS0TY_018776 [Phlomoides rotata]